MFSLESLKRAKNKPKGNAKHLVFAGFSCLQAAWCSSDTAADLHALCLVHSDAVTSASRARSPKCNPRHDSLAWSCIWWEVISVPEPYYGLFTGHIGMEADSHCYRKPLLAYECYYAINCFWYFTVAFFSLSVFSLLIYFLGQQPCFSASICLSNNVTIYCIIVLYSHFMLSHSSRHYLKIVKTFSKNFLPVGKWEMQAMQSGYHEKARRLGNGNVSSVWSPSGLRLRHLSCMCWRSSWWCFCLYISALHIDAEVCSQSLWIALYCVFIIFAYFWFEDSTTFFTQWSVNYYNQEPFVLSYMSRNEPGWLHYHGFNWIVALDRRDIEHLMMEGTYKDSRVQPLGPHHTWPPKTHIIFLRADIQDKETG